MRIATIDIGTNTVLLLIADIDDDGRIQTVAEEQRLPRLGTGVDQRGVIGMEDCRRVVSDLQKFLETIRKFQAERVAVCATSALRDASNQKDILRFIATETGLDVEVLTGSDEAQWTFRGVTNELQHGRPSTVVLDIGGGSTEITHPHPSSSNGDHQLSRYSLHLGSVRISERYFKHNPPLTDEINSAKQFILETLTEVRNPGFDRFGLLAVAGTATTLACLDQQLASFDRERVTGYQMERAAVVYWSRRLLSMSSTEIRLLSDVTEGRADILSAGVLILEEIMELFRFRSLTVSERGLRHGIALREWERAHTQPPAKG